MRANAGPQRRVAVRLDWHDGSIWIDLADGCGNYVQITSRGWRVTRKCPIWFVRCKGMLPLPVPKRNGDLNDLRNLVNLGSSENFLLLIGWVLNALRPNGPFLALVVNGEQGSAKSTLCRVVRRLIDPNVADLRAAPRDEQEIVIAAINSRIVAYDNLSAISPALPPPLPRR